MPEITARNFLHDITRLLGEASKDLGYAIRGSPEATMNYVSLMTGLRMDLARGACGWFSLKQAGIGEKEEYSEFEDLAVQWDRYSQFSLGALRILAGYLEGERLSQSLQLRVQIGMPFLTDLKKLLRKKSTILRSRTLWWNAALKWEELNEDRHTTAKVYDEH